MPPPPTLSLIVPTRGRPAPLRRFLDSVASTARRPERIEVVLVVDDDDPVSLAVCHRRLNIRHVVGPAGRTMGALNAAGYAASAGDFVMLLNDDVVVRTRGWDDTVLGCFERFPDRLALVHVNDTLVRDRLCVFPLVGRRFCELAGEICPTDYRRYRIDDHIEDVFNLLAVLGERRTVYLPDVVFEHRNAVVHPTAGRVYQSDPTILAEDAPRFDAHFPARKELALRVMAAIGGRGDPAAWRDRLSCVSDPFALRTPGRQYVVRAAWWKRVPGDAAAWVKRAGARVRTRYRLEGGGGLVHAAGRQVARMGWGSGSK